MPGPLPAGEMISVKGVARTLGISNDTVYRMIERGELDAVRVGSGRGVYRVALADLRRAVEQRRAKARPPHPSETEQLIDSWFRTCGTCDAMAVLRWVAEGAVRFQASFPHITARQPWAEYLAQPPPAEHDAETDEAPHHRSGAGLRRQQAG